jgi:uncharacterized membrane protein
VFLLLAAAGLTTGAGIALGRTTRATTAVTLLTMMRMSEYILTSAGAILVFLFGSLLVNERDYSFGDAWISAAMTLLIVVLAVDHGYLIRQASKSRDMAAALGDAPVSAELQRRISDPVTIILGLALDLSFLVFLWLMIDKPGS